MGTLPVFVGIDYHLGGLQVCAMDRSGNVLVNKSCANHWQAAVEVAESVGCVQRVAIEACTGSLDLAQELVDKAKWSVDLAHTTYVARMKRQPDKTDYSDARMLADLIRVGYLPRVWLPPKYIRELRALMSLRQSISQQKTSSKLRISAVLRDQRLICPHSKWSKQYRSWIVAKGNLTEVNRLIVTELLDQLTDLEDRIKRLDGQLIVQTAEDQVAGFLRQQYSVGLVTALTLRAAIGEASRFKTGKQMSHYCGLSPGNRSSGKRVADAGLVQSGNPQLRRTLMELGQRLGRTDQRWRAFKEKQRNNGKGSCLITAAIANRWVRGLHGRWKAIEKQLAEEAAAAKIKQEAGETGQQIGVAPR